MHKTANNRFSLFVLLAAASMFFQPTASISQTLSVPRAPCPAVMSHTNPAQQQVQGKPGHDQPLSGTLYDCGHPTNEEQLMLELINWARANPDSEGIILSTTQDPGVVNEYNGFPSSSRSEVVTDFATYPVRPPLAMNTDLLTAARDHDNAMIKYDSQYHVGPDLDPFTRITNAGYTDWTDAGENVFAFGDSDVFYDDAAFLIDFGNPGYGHRHNIMNFADGDAIYTEVGLGMVAGMGSGNPAGNVGPVLTTEDFVTGPKVFVLGVVYSDSNQNGFYDEGEGDSGVTITLSSGTTYYAVSSGSGGYAIPYTGSGNVTVTATGGVFKTTKVTKSVDLNGVNVKVDFGPDLSGLPSQVMLVSPVDDTTVTSTTVDFVWDTMAGAEYHIQIAIDPQFKTLFKNDSTITDASVQFSGLQDSITYYWRVQAKNLKNLNQVGQWSAPASFSISLPPSPVVLISPANGSSVGDSNILFTWNGADRESYDFWIIITSDKAGMDTVFQDNSQVDTTETVDPSNFVLGQTYYWEVLAENNNGWSTFGTPWSFTLGAQSSVAPAISTSSTPVTISPNPSKGSAQLQFTLPTSEDVSLRVFNSLGEQVQSLDLGWLSAGSNEYVWDGSGLLAGSYVCQLRMGDQIQNARVVILK